MSGCAGSGAGGDPRVIGMEGDDWVETMWTDEAKLAYQQKVDAFIAALRAHADLTLSRQGRQREVETYFASQASLGEAAHAFVDAEWDWCGSLPLPLMSPSDEDDWDDEDEGGPAGPFVSVVGRWDFRVADEAALVEAGRRAYLASWPDDTPEDASVRAHDPLSALGEILHGDDVEALGQAPGLEPLSSTIQFWTHDGDGEEADAPPGS